MAGFASVHDGRTGGGSRAAFLVAGVLALARALAGVLGRPLAARSSLGGAR